MHRTFESASTAKQRKIETKDENRGKKIVFNFIQCLKQNTNDETRKEAKKKTNDEEKKKRWNK